ncbi:MAG: hypothetical protein LM590_09250 [Thermofilum sp.]|nr:hypothetical protein [Thermofilum sp.]
MNIQGSFIAYEARGSIADIYVRERGLAVECETLLGAVPAPHLKVLESVRKYREFKEVKEVWVVLRNWPAAIHLGDLIRLESMLRRELKRKEVKFFVGYHVAEKELSEEQKELEEKDVEVRLVWMEKDGGLMVRLPRPVPVKRLVRARFSERRRLPARNFG